MKSFRQLMDDASEPTCDPPPPSPPGGSYTPTYGFFPERLYTSITELLHQDSSAHGGAAGNYRSRFHQLISPGPPPRPPPPCFGQRRCDVTAGGGAVTSSKRASRESRNDEGDAYTLIIWSLFLGFYVNKNR